MLRLLTGMKQDFTKKVQAIFPLRNRVLHGKKSTVSRDEAAGVIEVARALIEDYSFPDGP